jgi:glyceraldehyde 3-phosphate dehydrogenase
MAIRVGTNGLGRIGRNYLRYSLDADDLEVVAVNDIADATTLARLLRHDSTFGPLRHAVDVFDDGLVVDGKKIAVSSERDPSALNWRDAGVDVVIESTGKFRSRETAGKHLSAGARTVIISAPGKDVDTTIVIGVNEKSFDPRRHRVISNASCTTNCVAPMAKVLQDAFGIERAFMTTVHAYTNDQNVLDAPHKDPRRARSAAVNIIPTTTGAARAVGSVLPALAGRLEGVALRVPVVNGSLVDLAALLDRDVTVAEVNDAFTTAAEGSLAGILRYTTEPVVSTDVIGDAASCILDGSLTQVSERLVKVFGWYDNEWGYTCRLADLTRLVAAG